MPGHCALSLDNADVAQIKTDDPRRRRVIFFKETPLTYSNNVK
jgi:hypothetical protein